MTRTHRMALTAMLLLAAPAHASPEPTNGQDTSAPAGDVAPGGKQLPAFEEEPLPLMPVDAPGLKNFAKVSKELYRGAQPTAEGFRNLDQLGVKTVVNLRVTASDREAMAGLGLQYVEISFKPWHPEFEDLVPFLKLFEDERNLPVFVHCKHGSDRTGTMVALYRMVHQSWERERAIAELPRFGFHEIWDNLRGYLRAINLDTLRAAMARAEPTKVEVVK